MSPEAVSAIGSIGSAALNVAGGLFGSNAQENFQENFYKNRYQWQVEDMRKAGLNPALSYTTGAGSAGSGANYDLGSDVAGGFSKLVAARLASQQVNNAKADVDLKRSQEWKNIVDAQMSQTLGFKNIDVMNSQIDLNKANAQYGNIPKVAYDFLDEFFPNWREGVKSFANPVNQHLPSAKDVVMGGIRNGMSDSVYPAWQQEFRKKGARYFTPRKVPLNYDITPYRD